MCCFSGEIAAYTASTVHATPPLGDQVWGLKQPGQRTVQPCTQIAARSPGPSAAVRVTSRASRMSVMDRLDVEDAAAAGRRPLRWPKGNRLLQSGHEVRGHSCGSEVLYRGEAAGAVAVDDNSLGQSGADSG